jgi:hypothetical protein
MIGIAWLRWLTGRWRVWRTRTVRRRIEEPSTDELIPIDEPTTGKQVMTVKFLMIAEIRIVGGADDGRIRGSAISKAQARLDTFRKATLPAERHGICLYRISRNTIAAHNIDAEGIAIGPAEQGEVH